VTFAPTRRTLPFFLGRQPHFVAQLRAQPAAESHRFVPVDIRSRPIGLRPPRFCRLGPQEIVPPAIVPITIGVDEGLVLHIGDWVTRHVEGRKLALLSLLIDELPTRDLDPVERRQAAIVEADPCPRVADFGQAIANRQAAWRDGLDSFEFVEELVDFGRRRYLPAPPLRAAVHRAARILVRRRQAAGRRFRPRRSPIARRRGGGVFGSASSASRASASPPPSPPSPPSLRSPSLSTSGAGGGCSSASQARSCPRKFLASSDFSGCCQSRRSSSRSAPWPGGGAASASVRSKAARGPGRASLPVFSAQ
jgi:hypothetical protein